MIRIFRRKNPKKELKKIVGNHKLPTFSAVAMKAMQALRNDNRSMSDVANILVSDSGLSSIMLKNVNSASSGLRHEVSNIAHAAALLGRSRLEAMVVAAAARSALPATSSAFPMVEFWHNATRRAAVARGLAQSLHPQSAMASYTASLLQDMALPILAEAKPDYKPVLDEWRNSSESLCKLEQEAFGCTHVEVAGWLCMAWGLPDELTGPIVTHHDDIQGFAKDTSAPPAVLLVAELGEGEEADRVDKLVERAQAEFNLAPDECLAIIKNGFAEGDETSRLFGS